MPDWIDTNLTPDKQAGDQLAAMRKREAEQIGSVASHFTSTEVSLLHFRSPSISISRCLSKRSRCDEALASYWSQSVADIDQSASVAASLLVCAIVVRC
jgi:hypothetical protein